MLLALAIDGSLPRAVPDVKSGGETEPKVTIIFQI